MLRVNRGNETHKKILHAIQAKKEKEQRQKNPKVFSSSAVKTNSSHLSVSSVWCCSHPLTSRFFYQRAKKERKGLFHLLQSPEGSFWQLSFYLLLLESGDSSGYAWFRFTSKSLPLMNSLKKTPTSLDYRIFLVCIEESVFDLVHWVLIRNQCLGYRGLMSRPLHGPGIKV